MPAKIVARRRVRTITAVQPNAGVEAWYERELADLLGEAHTDLSLKLSLLVSQLDGGPAEQRAVGHLVTVGEPVIGVDGRIMSVPVTAGWEIAQDAPPRVTKIDRLLKSWGDRWRLKFDKLSLDLAKKFAAKNFQHTETAMRAALKGAGFTVKFKTTKASMAAYKGVVAENVNLIKSIPQQYLTGVQSAVWSSVNRGADMASLSKALRQNYGATVKRAALISRDQNNKAKAVIENARRQELGITQAIWQHSSAGKEPRPSHMAMNNKVFDLKQGMWDSDEQEWVLPGQLINCRCTSRAIIPGVNES